MDIPQVKKSGRHVLQRTSGVIAIEFAILTIVLLLIVGGIIEFGRIFWHYNALTKATRDGARLLSVASKASISTVGVVQAKNLVVASANAAGVIPQLTTANVTVACLNNAYQAVACDDGTAPANVEVTVQTTLGVWMPMILPAGGVTFAPSTVMRYML